MDIPEGWRIAAIVPAYNEAARIGSVVEELRAQSIPLDVVVVDDGSEDGTARAARAAGARVLVLPFNLGIGGAVQTGLRFALRRGYAAAVRVDGDGQHEARCVAEVLAPVITGKADLGVGSRFLDEEAAYRSSVVRRMGIRFFARLISLLTGAGVTDPTSGFTAFSSRAIRLFARSFPVDFPEPEAILMARRHGLRVEEVPVRMRPRPCGVSSIRYLRTLYYMIKVTCALLLHIIKPKKEVPR